MHSFYFVEVDKGVPIGPVAMDLQFSNENQKVARWYNCERWQEVTYSNLIKNSDDTIVKIVTDYKTITFTKLELSVYNEKLKSRVRTDFQTNEELYNYLMKTSLGHY